MKVDSRFQNSMGLTRKEFDEYRNNITALPVGDEKWTGEPIHEYQIFKNFYIADKQAFDMACKSKRNITFILVRKGNLPIDIPYHFSHYELFGGLTSCLESGILKLVFSTIDTELRNKKEVFIFCGSENNLESIEVVLAYLVSRFQVSVSQAYAYIQSICKNVQKLEMLSDWQKMDQVYQEKLNPYPSLNQGAPSQAGYFRLDSSGEPPQPSGKPCCGCVIL